MPPAPLDDLAVVPLSALVLHEAVEPRRADAVRVGMRRTGVLNDPIVATPAPDGRWLVLDGAHRTTALAALGVGAAVVQTMRIGGLDGTGERMGGGPAPDGDDAGAVVDAWAHELTGPEATTLLDTRAPRATAGSASAGSAVVAVVEGAGRRVEVIASADLPGRLAAMWDLAGRYTDLRYVRRHPGDPGPAAGAVRVTWAPALPSDLADLADLGATFPAGVSRFIVRGRVLGVRIPLAELARTASGGVRGEAAAVDLLARLRRLPVRLYSEPVWVVESAEPIGLSEDPNRGR
jgi:hypothetical protein